MHLFFLFSLSFYLFIQVSAQYDYTTATACTTRLGNKSLASVPTANTSVNKSVTYTKVLEITPVQTVTPPISTITKSTTSQVTVFVTTTNVVVQTQTNTVISSTITTTTTTSTTTVTTTSTTFTSTIIPTSAGFTPLAAAADYVARKRSESGESAERFQIRGAKLKPRAAASTVNVFVINGVEQESPTQYPTAVDCATTVIARTTITQTTTGTTKTTTIKASSLTITMTALTTVTQTTGIDGGTTTTTITSTSTVSAVSTVSETATLTQTVVAPFETFFKACNAVNLVQSANGYNQIYEYRDSGVKALDSYQVRTPYECCVLCQRAPGCIGSAILRNAADDYGHCRFFVPLSGETCSDAAGSQLSYGTTSDTQGAALGFTLSNGPCGSWVNLGNDPS